MLSHLSAGITSVGVRFGSPFNHKQVLFFGPATNRVGFDRWCNSIPDTLPEFLTLRDTFTSRREHILNYFDYRVTNAFAESSNNIIKSIEKQGKGYDFDTLRKIALFSSRMEEFQKFDSKNAEYIKSWQF